MNKRIGILTQPLGHNYGGLLQAYALCEVLKQMGYEPIVLDRRINHTILRKALSHGKTILCKFLGRKRKFTMFLSDSDKDFVYKGTNIFINKYISNVPLYSDNKLKSFAKKESLCAYVVGSDQVWRPCYSLNLPTYFLDFVKGNKSVKKLSYAASFGVDTWEFTEEQTLMAKKLIKEFDRVSVREDSGVKLCKEFLDCEAEHVLDPTMLLKKEHYIKLFEQEGEARSSGNLFTYVLDRDGEKESVIKRYEKELHLQEFTSQPKEAQLTREGIKNNIEDYKYPTVTKWLRSFYDAEFVITDSFHGCVFSILFNKPFIAILNHGRGASRFYSLLKMFGLEDRIYTPDSDYSNRTIDWNQVNEKLNTLRKHSKSFLIEQLNG